MTHPYAPAFLSGQPPVLDSRTMPQQGPPVPAGAIQPRYDDPNFDPFWSPYGTGKQTIRWNPVTGRMEAVP
jgi:hypothetical protein